MIPLDEARAHVLAACRVLPAVRSTPEAGVGRVLADQVVAALDMPRFRNSAMDGYALRASDTVSAPVTLDVVGSVTAGEIAARPVGPGEAVRIMTGAPVPDGADAICMVEATAPAAPVASGHTGPGTTAQERVVISTRVSPGEHVRPAGDDFAAGDHLFPAGTAIGPAHLGVMISAGVEMISIVGVPRVGVLSTGDELVGTGGALRPGTIPDSNRPALLAQIAADGFVPVDLGTASDSEPVLAGAIERAAGRCDAIVTSGGVSVGDHDYVKVVLEKLSGGTMAWMQIAIKPAKPFAFGILADSGVAVFGLPGNPVSTLVSYELLVRPALRMMGGHRQPERQPLRAVAPEGIRRRADGRLHFLRVLAGVGSDGALEVRSAGAQGSHQMRSMAAANALAIVPDGPGVAPGGAVDILLLDADRLGGPEPGHGDGGARR